MNDMWGNPILGTNNNFDYTGGYNRYYPRYEIIKVNGEAGAKNFRMAPNSNALLLDETGAVVWHAQTDGTGYLTVTPYDLIPRQVAQPVDINDLANRVSQLEESLNARQSNSQPNKQRKQRNTTTEQPTNIDTTG